MKKLLSVVLIALLGLAFSMQAAAADGTDFADVSAGAWYAEAVAYCQEQGLMNGTTNSTFEPDSSLTRAMLVTILYRASGEPAISGKADFSDTAEGQWYSSAVLWATRQGIITGYGNGLFGTNDDITQEQLNLIMSRYAGQTFTQNIPGYVGDSTPATRAQVAAVLLNMSNGEQVNSTANTQPNSSSKVLIAYFSRYGNTDYGSNVDATTSASVVATGGQQQGTTELIARLIAAKTGGELHLIETADAYPTDFNAVVSQNHQELAGNYRPSLTNNIDVSEYDVIFVGYPVWASTAPTPVLSFLESLNLSGKTVVPFCTHDGYGAGSSYSAISGASSGAKIMQGLAIDSSSATAAESDVNHWLDSLDINATAANIPQTNGETALRITIGEQELSGVLYDSDMARQFIAQLPQTITMTNYGGREVYGGIEQAIAVSGEGQLHFADGDITYCPTNNTAAIFYSQSSRPNLTMQVYPIGRVTSDLAIFPDLPSRVEITFEVIS